jgi:signal transduction histidine kinase
VLIINKTDLTALIIILIIVGGSYFLYWQQPNEFKNTEIVPLQLNASKNIGIVSYVNKAVELVDEKGNASFNEFYTSKWYHGDIYIFIWQLDGIRIVYPPDPKAVGQNLTDLKDYDGKPIGKLFIETAKKGEGWVEYKYPKPGESTPSVKLTYIKRAHYQDQAYLVGSGVYLN